MPYFTGLPSSVAAPARSIPSSSLIGRLECAQLSFWGRAVAFASQMACFWQAG